MEKRESTTMTLKLPNLIKAYKFAEALENGTTTVKLLVSPTTLEKAFKDIQTSQRQFVSFTTVEVEGIGSKKAAKVLLKFEKGGLLAVAVVNGAGLIARFRLKPAKLAVSDIPVFVLGHSLGAIVAPMAANADTKIKG